MARKPRSQTCAETITALLNDGQQHEVQDIATHCEPYSLHTVRNELNKLCHQGVAVRHVKIIYCRPTVGK